MLRNLFLKLLSRCALVLAAGIFFFNAPSQAQLEPQPGQRELEEKKAPVLTKPPELLEGSQPVYPQEVQKENIEGVVTLKLTIDATGQVAQVEVTQGLHPLLDEAAMMAATRLVFSPAEVDGQPAPIQLLFNYHFALDVQTDDTPPEEREEVLQKPSIINFEGIVRSAGKKNPLFLAEVTVESKEADVTTIVGQTQTDEKGRFLLANIPDGKHLVRIALAGFELFETNETFTLSEKTQLIAYLRPKEAHLFETVVRKKRAEKEVARITLSREEVRRIPGTFGDPLRVLENLPGTARLPFIGGALIVRGASPQDSGVYFDGVEVPILYHFGGLTSIVNAEFLERIDFMPGGFGANYGRATGGIIDVASRKLQFDEFRGAAEVDLIDSGFFFGGPLKIGELPTINFGVAARRSYVDSLLPIVLDAFLGPDGQAVTAAPVYWDFQAKTQVRLAKGQRFSLLAFGSNDDLAIVSAGIDASSETEIGTTTQFSRVIAQLDSKLTPELRHTFRPYVGRDTSKFGVESGIGITAATEARVDVYGLRDSLTIQPKPWLKFETGLDLRLSEVAFMLDFPIPINVGGFPRVESEVVGSNQIITSRIDYEELGAFVEGEIGPISGLTLIAGLRLDEYGLRFYPQELPDGTSTAAGRVRRLSLDPRMTLRWKPLSATSFKGAFGIYERLEAQSMGQVLGNPNLLPERSFQWVLGVEHAFSQTINVDLQWYYNHRDRLVQSSSKVTVLGDGQFKPEVFDNGGWGRTYGMELLLRHEITRNFFGWIAYTLSLSERDLNQDEERLLPTPFDQRHILTVVGQTKLPWNFTLGVRVRVVTGTRDNAPVGSTHDLDTTDFDAAFAQYVRDRKPTYQQLDVRVDRKWVFDVASITTYLDLLNATNATNVEFYQNDFRFRDRAPIAGLPILPVVGLLGEF